MALRAVRGQPGTYVIPELGKAYILTESYEGDKYDTVEVWSPVGAVVAGQIPAGSAFQFFQNPQNKREIDTNLRTPGRLPIAEGMVLHRVGLMVHLAGGNITPIGADIKKVLEDAYFHFDVNNKTIAEGPALAFPSGMGLTGMTQEANQCVISNGVASSAAAMTLIRPQDLTGKEHEIFGEITYQARIWLASAQYTGAFVGNQIPTLFNPILVKCLLHGLVKAKATV